jgi:hypothetical protein
MEKINYLPNGQWQLEKGWKGALTGAALAGSMISPGSAQDTHVDMVNSIKDSHPVLHALAQVESSGGKDVKHDTMNRGMHAGHTAGGPWGLMPKTAAYILRADKNLRKKYPQLTEKSKDLDTHHGAITSAMNDNPEVAFDFAKALHDRKSWIFDGDPHKIAHAWYFGIGAAKKAARKNEHRDNFYNKKFDMYYKDPRQPATTDPGVY